MPSALKPAQRALLDRIARGLARIPGVVAVALGGSQARGTARPDSDLDIGIYYRAAAPFDVEAIRRLAADLDPRPARVVTGFHEWGPWVNGGAWLSVDGQRVDFLYRDLDQIDRVIEASQRGERVWDYTQQPTHGFHSPILLAELEICEPLFDPAGELVRRKARIAVYPPALKERNVRDFLWHAEFTLFHARDFAARGDVYNTAGCLCRASACLVQVLHAEAERYFLSDKTALDGLDPAVGRELSEILARPGATAQELLRSVARLARLREEIAGRCGARQPGRALPGG